MYHSRLTPLLLCIVIWLSALLHTANAKLTIQTLNGEIISNSTADYFLYRQPYYKYRGIGMLWKFYQNPKIAGPCAPMPINASDPTIQDIAKVATMYPNFAMAFDYESMWAGQ